MEKQPTNGSISVLEQRLIQRLLCFLNSPRTGPLSFNQLVRLNQTLTTLLGLMSEGVISMPSFLELGIISESVSSKKGKSSPEASPLPSSSTKSGLLNCDCGGEHLEGAFYGSLTPTTKSSLQTLIGCMGCGSLRPRSMTNQIGLDACEQCLAMPVTWWIRHAPNLSKHLLKLYGQTPLKTSTESTGATAKPQPQESDTQTSSTQRSMRYATSHGASSACQRPHPETLYYNEYETTPKPG